MVVFHCYVSLPEGTPIWGRWTHFDEHIFQMGWNYQPGYLAKALHLRLTLLPLEADARGVASHEVRLADFPSALQQIKAVMEVQAHQEL